MLEDDVGDRQEAVDVWKLPPAVKDAVDDRGWLGILAPPGLLSRSQRPLNLHSQLNSAQWITMAKVTGKYLLGLAFEGKALESLCDLLDYVTLCLSDRITPSLLTEIGIQAKRCANMINETMPEGEFSLVLHMLIFHVPATLKRWGPARGWWVFPFER